MDTKAKIGRLLGIFSGANSCYGGLLFLSAYNERKRIGAFGRIFFIRVRATLIGELMDCMSSVILAAST